MSRPTINQRTVLAAAAPLLVVVLLVAAWGLDTAVSSGEVRRNVSLGAVAIGGMDRAEVTAVANRLGQRFADRTVHIRADDARYEATADQLGLRVDASATADAAMAVGRDGSWFTRPFTWLTSLASDRQAPLRYTLRRDQLEPVLLALEGEDTRTPSEPVVTAGPEGFTATEGVAGKVMQSDEVGDKLLAKARRGADLSIAVDPLVREPEITDVAARRLARELTTKTAQPLAVNAAQASTEVAPATVRSWIGVEAAGDRLKVTFDGDQALEDVTAAFGDLGGEPRSADFTLSGGEVEIIPSQNGLRCCAEGVRAELRAATLEPRAANVELVAEEPELTTREAENLGIEEPVGTTTTWKGQRQIKSFTTYHSCCENRVHNIHTMADTVRGTLLVPGETFSINDVVGRRTREKDYLADGAILGGEFVQEVGGGVSQFSTTLFNAAFFAGLPIPTYKAHSEYFSRYPYGREATMGYPYPDLEFTNNTPHGIMVWTSYTDTSITVTLYSTQYAYGEQTGQSTGTSGNCTTVTTERTIHYRDGSTATDSFNATYRQGDATRC